METEFIEAFTEGHEADTVEIPILPEQCRTIGVRVADGKEFIVALHGPSHKAAVQSARQFALELWAIMMGGKK